MLGVFRIKCLPKVIRSINNILRDWFNILIVFNIQATLYVANDLYETNVLEDAEYLTTDFL